tara:strand:+ start:36 stop:464 length:429 start_codon:yes stop_codon:yes gene_type:complete
MRSFLTEVMSTETPGAKGGPNAEQTVVSAVTKLLDAGHIEHARLAFDIYDRAVEESSHGRHVVIYIELIEAIGNSANNIEVVKVDQVRKELNLPAGPPNPGVQGANVDDIPTGEGPHPDVEAPQKESVDVSLYLESFRFPSK